MFCARSVPSYIDISTFPYSMTFSVNHKTWLLRAACLSAWCFLMQPVAFAVPYRSPEATITGRIVGFAWRSEMTFVQESEDQLRFWEYVPDHYVLILSKINLDPKTAKLISECSSHPHVRVSPALEIPEGGVLVFIRSSKIKAIKVGANIELVGYFASGDERGTTSQFEELRINGKVILKRKVTYRKKQ